MVWRQRLGLEKAMLRLEEREMVFWVELAAGKNSTGGPLSDGNGDAPTNWGHSGWLRLDIMVRPPKK